MFLSNLPLLLRAILLSLSFFGLCAASRRALKLNRFIAPAFCANVIVCTLMLAGMLHALEPGFYLLFFGGLAGLVYAFIFRKTKPDLKLIGLFTLFAGYLAWRLGPTHLTEWDDLSHWGLVARHLLSADAFPDASTTAVTFQAYPLGAAAFIYYVGKALGNAEGIYLVAQNLLYGLLFLPVFAHIRSNRSLLFPAAGFLFLLLFRFNHDMTHLFVDWLLAFSGIGTAASILYYRNDLKKALLTVIPGVMAVVLFKSSGLFFMATSALLIAMCCRKEALNPWRTLAITLAILCAGAGAYFCWTIHVKTSFPAGMTTKHAVNLASYAKNLGNKSLITILRIVKRMLVALIRPYFFQVFSVLFMAGGFAAVRFSCRRSPALAPLRSQTVRGLWFAAALYVFWHAMIFFTYVFSMSTAEALRLASYWRYSTTGLIYMMGLSAIFLLDFFASERFHPGRSMKYVLAAAALICLAAAPWLVASEFDSSDARDYYPHFIERETEYNALRKGTRDAKAAYNLPEDGNYLIYAGGDVIVNAVNAYYRAVKYDLNSLNIHTVARIVPASGEIQETPEYSIGYPAPKETCASPVGFLSEHLADYDAFLVLFKDEPFESVMKDFMKTYTGATPIVFIYE